MKKVVITGNCGFIGSNLVRACLEKGWKVCGVDNFSGSKKEMADIKRFNNANYSFNNADILDTNRMTEIFSENDIVFHLAALPRVQYSTDFPIESNKNNVSGTLSVLEAASKAGIKRVIYSASSSMYGGQDIKFPTPEDARAHPRSNYALQKYVGLEYCRLYSELYGLDTVSLIYFNVFGLGQVAGSSYATIIPAFFEAAAEGNPCRIDGTGAQSRDFCYIDNVVQANILAAEYKNKLLGESFNIACGEHYSVNDVFKIVNELYEGSVKKEYATGRLGDPIKSHADISKAINTLGYEPKVKFKKGMQLTYDWWKNGCKII